MNRVLETYGADSEFSQSRLLDEDETLKTELSTIRVSYKYLDNEFFSVLNNHKFCFPLT